MVIDDKVLVVVPARGGSKRVPGKNLRQVGGLTLIERAAQFIRGEGLLDCAVLSTDDPAIAECGRSAGLNVPFLRPASLSSDDAQTSDVVMHAIEWRCSVGNRPDVVAVVQTTTPFRRKGLLRDALSLLRANATANAVIAMRSLGMPAKYVHCQDPTGTVESISASERRPGYLPTGSLYVTRTEALTYHKTLYVPPIMAIETDGIEAIDIDVETDLVMAQLVSGHPRFAEPDLGAPQE